MTRGGGNQNKGKDLARDEGKGGVDGRLESLAGGETEGARHGQGRRRGRGHGNQEITRRKGEGKVPIVFSIAKEKKKGPGRELGSDRRRRGRRVSVSPGRKGRDYRGRLNLRRMGRTVCSEGNKF